MDDFDADEQPNMFAVKEYRLLTPLFCRLLCVLATSAPVERVFSLRGLIMRPNRARIDAYSMAREICEVIMSNEITSRRFGGPGIEVEVDECFLTRRKYHKGRRLRSGTITLFGIYECESNLGCHCHVKDHSQAVLISEIQRFIAPGTRII